MGHFGPKIIVRPQSSGFTLKIFLKFFTMKGAKEHMKFILVIFAKKILLRVKMPKMPKMLCPQNSGSALQDLFIILHNEIGEEAHEN